MRWAHALCILAMILATQSRADADRVGVDGNAWVDEDWIGAPILRLATPWLDPGKTYEFETYALVALPGSSFADTVMSVQEGALATYESLAGADECAPGGAFEQWERSCFTFHVDSSSYPSGRIFYLLVRAWQTHLAGTARVRYREVGSGTWIEITSGPRTFGGYVVTDPGPNMAGWVQIQTTALPGADPGCFDGGHCDHHFVRFTDPNGDTVANWSYAANYDWAHSGDAYTLDRGAGGTAHFEWVGGWLDLPSGNPPATIVVGPVVPIGAPFRILRNTETDGWDHDGDGLGLQVERILDTCDIRSEGGCNLLPHCTAAGPQCTASLRDSDGDGIRDDAEVFGVDETIMPDGNHLPRFGANPARYDLFVELDNYGELDELMFCDPVQPQLTEAEMVSAWQVFQNVPVQNRDGTTGISAHFDAGYNPSTPALDHVFGLRYGSDSCLIVPEGEHVYTVGMEDHRRWIWRHLVRGTGGQMAYLALSGFHVDAAGVVHELGHSAGLAHYGPATARDLFNGKPHYVSRMNYIYERAGGGALDGALGDRIPYSTGAYAAVPVNPLFVNETVMYHETGNIDLLDTLNTRFAGFLTYDLSSASYQVDYDRDASLDSYTQAAVCARDTHIQRFTQVNARDASNRCDQSTHAERYAHRRGGDLAIAGDHLIWAKIDLDTQAVDTRLRVYVNDGIACNSQELAPMDSRAVAWSECGNPFGTTNGFPPCWDADSSAPDPSMVVNRSDGSPVRPLAVAAKGWSAGAYNMFLVVYVDLDGFGATLRYGTLVPDGSGIGLAWSDKGPVPGAAPLRSPLEADGGAWGLSLAGLGSWESSGYMLLTYRDSSDRVMQHYIQVIDADSVNWWSAAEATEVGGVPVTIDTASLATPGSVRVSGAYGDGVVMLVPEDAGSYEQWRILFREAAAAEWMHMATIASSVGVRGRPAIAQASYSGGDRLIVVWKGAEGNTNNHLLHYAETSYDDYTPQLIERLYGTYHAAMDPTMVYDTRPTAIPSGLRLVYGQWRDCPETGVACDAFTECVAVPDTGKAFCDAPDEWFGRVREMLVPFADGVFPATLRDYDDTPMVDYGFCQALRLCNMMGVPCIPPEYQDSDGSGGILTVEPCGSAPSY